MGGQVGFKGAEYILIGEVSGDSDGQLRRLLTVAVWKVDGNCRLAKGAGWSQGWETSGKRWQE